MKPMRAFALMGIFALSSATHAIATDGDGPGTATITFPGDEVKMYGMCIDWAFRTGEGVPYLILEAGAEDGKSPVFQEDARLSLGDAFWEIRDVDRFEPTPKGYVLAGTFADLKSTRAPEPVTISVVCD